jgi:hypothetical protein
MERGRGRIRKRPHALAIAHNLAISTVRIKGIKAIKETTEWIAAH